MKTEEIITLGTKLGLTFIRDTNWPSFLDANIVYFSGSNGQRFKVDGNAPDDDVYKSIGLHLINYGKRLKCIEIDGILSINNDY